MTQPPPYPPYPGRPPAPRRRGIHPATWIVVAAVVAAYGLLWLLPRAGTWRNCDPTMSGGRALYLAATYGQPDFWECAAVGSH